jgi:hypothetical protein
MGGFAQTAGAVAHSLAAVRLFAEKHENLLEFVVTMRKLSSP